MQVTAHVKHFMTDLLSSILIPLCDINIILDAKESDVGIGDFSTMFIKTYAKSISEKGLTITKIDLDDFNRFIVYFEDRFRNRFRCCICMREDYLNYTYRVILKSINGSLSSLYCQNREIQRAIEKSNALLKNIKPFDDQNKSK